MIGLGINQNSNEARIRQLEKRLQSAELGSQPKSLNFDASAFQAGSLQAWPSQTQEISPDSRLTSQNSEDDEDENDDAFAVVSLSEKKRKKRKLNTGEYERLTPKKTSVKAKYSQSPKIKGKARSRPPTPLKEQSNTRTPDKGRKKSQYLAQKNTLQNYFNEQSMSPKPSRRESCIPEDQVLREAQWHQDRDKLFKLKDEMRKERDAAIDKYLEEKDKVCCLEERVKKADTEIESLKNDVKLEQSTLQQVDHLWENKKEKWAAREAQMRKGLLATAMQAALAERELSSMKVQADSIRLGNLSWANSGHLGLQEVWEDGDSFKNLDRRQQHLAAQRDSIESARKNLRKRLPPPERFSAANQTQTSNAGNKSPQVSNATQSSRITPDEYVTQDEILKARLTSIKREDEGLQRDRERLELEKQQHLRELRRVKDEESSSHCCGMIMSDRYMLQKLLGKGGFSEVYQAFDVEQVREVAVKVHQLNSSWSDAKKASYVKHATREFEIHKRLQHPKIVALMDIFELDNNSFATVLELCPEGDLDTYLKQHQVLPEKEAKVIISQIFQGLAYLNDNERNQHVIHYDIKPANILFDKLGQVKITDFGLSKIANETSNQSIELTSQGAGTYWYLPPEVFEIGHQPPKISNKVDVWSAAVILYQMLYGKRPFGDGLTQEAILREDIMLNARQVTFPNKPSVSQEGKDFITRCLAYRQKDRVDVLTASKDPYLTLKRPRPSTGPS